MNRLPMHEALKKIAFLQGTWKIKGVGKGQYPKIKNFTYCDEITFDTIGQPMFNYTSQSWHPEEKRPMHREVGFMKILPNTNKLSFILSHNLGVTTIEEGTVEQNFICLSSIAIIRECRLANTPALLQTRREYKVCGDTLEYVFYMATAAVPNMSEHLRASYVKESKSSKGCI